ncbi:hypothetical protein AMATHDRAFT_137985 [Amanita thiersii Skay4041]|uniref:Probable RNA polymerase II nuclear localization protein SLC7A6OS n=1 Tax=Amanita thiersii Skay4041 TaxID=703135 RepID=A0A2A9NTG0_9AGAR|nr:hypothetical protein AMATHDRAFT_137985 [Amanita thiersii Skay4041]
MHHLDPSTSPPEQEPYSILRIKRKRGEEPLDALVVDSRVRRKKSRRGKSDIEVFQFAQTVEDAAWKDERKQRDLQDQISRLTREASTRDEGKSWQQADETKTSSHRQPRDDLTRRYTILEHKETEYDGHGRRIRKPYHSPTVIPVKDLAKATQPEFKLYDAVPSSSKPLSPIDAEIDKFLPLLNDYLSLHNLTNSQQTVKLPQEKQDVPLSSENSTKRLEDDYVWDVFYRRPATLDEWGDNANIARLTGLPSSFDHDLYDSASDSEFEDEADEDSNAEDFYKNDYPDEEECSGMCLCLS